MHSQPTKTNMQLFALISLFVAVLPHLAIGAAVVDGAVADPQVTVVPDVADTPEDAARILAGAGATCRNWSIVPNTADIQATCNDTSGVGRYTRLPLGRCLTNRNGQLACQVG